jgi:hypothetical protein
MIQIENIKKKTINISPDAVSGRCEAKCIYNYDYPPNSVVKIKHETYFISIEPDPDTTSTTSPVTYNEANYNVTKGLLFSPSLHLFNNNKMDAEIMIEHIAVSGGRKLFVCIPVRKMAGDSSQMLSAVVNGTAKKAPAVSETTTITVEKPSTFNDMLPKGPFFSYTGKYGEETCDFIVYGKLFSLAFSEGDLKTLQDMIKPFHLPMLGEYLFVNSKGANIDGGKKQDGIYINCQPTGTSEETTEVTTTSTSSTSDDVTGWSESTVKKLWMAFFITAITAIVLYGMNSFFKATGYIKTTTSDLSDKFTWSGFGKKTTP